MFKSLTNRAAVAAGLTLVLAAGPFALTGCAGAPAATSTESSWTFSLYLCGSDLESRHAEATRTLRSCSRRISLRRAGARPDRRRCLLAHRRRRCRCRPALRGARREARAARDARRGFDGLGRHARGLPGVQREGGAERARGGGAVESRRRAGGRRVLRRERGLRFTRPRRARGRVRRGRGRPRGRGVRHRGHGRLPYGLGRGGGDARGGSELPGRLRGARARRGLGLRSARRRARCGR